MAAGLPLMKSVLTPVAQSVLLPLGLSVTSRCRNSKKIFESRTAALIISNEETDDIMKIVKSLEESVLLTRRISETIKSKVKEQKGGFLEMLLGTLVAGLLGSAFTGRGVIRAGEGTIRVGENY